MVSSGPSALDLGLFAAPRWRRPSALGRMNGLLGGSNGRQLVVMS
jgi:hypothetical protein